MTRRVVAWDTETALIRPALLAPPLVCVTWQRPGVDARISVDCKPILSDWLRDTETLLVGHNIAYDLGVVGEAFPELLPDIFEAYASDRVTDTKIRQQLLDIAAGCYRGRLVGNGHWIKHEYSLDALAKRMASMQLQKDEWRLSYAEFLGIPLNRWPERAREVQAKARERLAALPDDDEHEKERAGLVSMIEGDPERCVSYPLDDARATLAVFEAQEKHVAYLADQFRQARAAWWLHLSSAWGLRTDASGVDKLRAETDAQIAEMEAQLVEAGLVRPEGTRDTKAAAARMVEVCRREGLPIRRTASHTDECPPDGDCHVCLDADACAATDDPILSDYAELSTLKKVRSNDVEALARGTTWPIHPRYDIAETGRTTCSRGGRDGLGANIQNLRRKAGIREAFVPRPGRVFAQADYPQLELYALAQCCMSWFGASKLAEALNAGKDPHLVMAAKICGIPYDEAAKNKKRKDVDDARQVGKVFNFGKPGGLGNKRKQPDGTYTEGTLITFARKTYGIEMSIEQCEEYERQWHEMFPEMKEHFDRVRALCNTHNKLATVETLFTKRYRGGASYCAACNNGFQALGADCAKNAGWLIARAEYVDRSSPLFNGRTVTFVHDEFIVEVDDDARAHDAAHELARLMVEGANVYLPDVPVPLSKMEPLLMRRWSKKAEQRFEVAVDGVGKRLVPWE